MINKITSLNIFLVVLLTLFSLEATTQTIEWAKSFGGSQDEHGYEIQPTTDGGFIVIGGAESTNGDLNGNNGTNGTQDVWVFKLGSAGNLEWQKNLGGSEYDGGRSIQVTQDGGYIIAAASDSDDGDVGENNGSRDFWIVKLTSNGNVEWKKTFGGSGWDFPESIKQTDDLGYIIVGISAFFTGDLDYWILKIDSMGTRQWQKKYGGSSDEYSTTIEITDDQGYIIAGRSQSNDEDVSGNYGGYDLWIVKLDQAGAIQWEKNYGGSEEERANDIKQTADGGFIIVGRSKSSDFDVSNNYGNADCWLVKIDANGAIQWEKNYGGSEYDSGSSIDLSPDGGYIIAGSSASSDIDVNSNFGNSDYWLFKVDSSGLMQWEKNYGGSGSDLAISAFVIDENNYIMTGQCRSSNGDVTDHIGGNDAWIVKVKNDVTSIDAVQIGLSTALEIFPNPSSGSFFLQTDSFNDSFDLTIYDELGRIVYYDQSTSKQIDLTGISKGIYWLKISNEESRAFKKLIIL